MYACKKSYICKLDATLLKPLRKCAFKKPIAEKEEIVTGDKMTHLNNASQQWSLPPRVLDAVFKYELRVSFPTHRAFTTSTAEHMSRRRRRWRRRRGREGEEEEDDKGWMQGSLVHNKIFPLSHTLMTGRRRRGHARPGQARPGTSQSKASGHRVAPG